MAAPTSSQVKYATSPLTGVNFTQTYAPASTSNPYSYAQTPAPFDVGQIVYGQDGSEWMFVLAGEDLVQYVTASIDTNGSATVMTLAKNRALTKVGWPQVAISNGYYGWVCLRGQAIGVLARLSSLAGVPCYISNVSAGRLTTTSVRNTSGGTILGVVLTTSVTASPSGATVANATWPLQSRVNG